MHGIHWTSVVVRVMAGIVSPLLLAHSSHTAASAAGRRPVHPLFELSSPTRSPFPSDRFTVADPAQNTGRRVALPAPADCVAHASECWDVVLLNQLDGFNILPRLSIPFDGAIDLATATSHNVFIVALGSALPESDGDDLSYAADPLSGNSTGVVVGITQVVWDPVTLTLHATTEKALDEHSRYALVVTTGVRDVGGRPIAPSEAFRHYRSDLARAADPELRWYRHALLAAERAARRVGVRKAKIAAVSLFSTQSATYLVQKVREQVSGVEAPVADFNVGPDGSRAVFPFTSVVGMNFNREIAVGGPLSPTPVPMAGLQLVPQSVGRIAFGRVNAADFMVHPGEYIPEVATRTGVASVHGTNTLSFIVTVPAGPMPSGGWPVAIYGHGSQRSKIDVFDSASSLAARGIAAIAFSMVGHGFGPTSTITIVRRGWTTATVLSGGRGLDQDGNGTIEAREGDAAAAPRLLQVNADAQVQNIADLMQFARVIQSGLDIDGDHVIDLNPDRMYYYGHSLGGMYGMGFVAYTPEVRAAFFLAPGAPLLENRRLSPTQRHQFGELMAARTPSLINGEGLTTIGEVPLLPPFFNENLPLRDEPSIVNTIEGAIAIQQFADRSTWIAQRGSPLGTAPRLRLRPPSGISPRPFVVSFARGDTASPNPNTTNIIRAGAFEDRVALYRHDRYWTDHPTIPKNPHGYFAQLIPVPAYVTLVRGAQAQVAEFFRSDGVTMLLPDPAAYWEVPVLGPLPEDFGYIK